MRLTFKNWIKNLLTSLRAEQQQAYEFTENEGYAIKNEECIHLQVGKTIINRTQGTKIASEGLKGRVFEISLGDLNNSEFDFR